MWKENGALNFRFFFFQQRLDSKKKMEESQKSKNMRSMCSFQQANNHRKRICKFYKTDLSSSQFIVNVETRKWKMQQSHLVAAGILLKRRMMRWLMRRMPPSWHWWFWSSLFDNSSMNVMHSIENHIEWAYTIDLFVKLWKSRVFIIF